MRISALIPTLNEEDNIGPAVSQALSCCAEAIVSDGGSSDGTVERALALTPSVIRGPAGRGGQLARAAREATGDVLLFLHADTRLPPAFDSLIAEALSRPGAGFGAFSLAISPRSPATDRIAFGANLRTRLFKLPYGDQAVFATRAAYDRAGGFSPLPILEDVDLALRLRRQAGFSPARGAAVSSARRWQKEGALKATLRNYALLALFLGGVPAGRLARWYRKG